MYSDYEKYILNIRNSLIQCGVEFPDGATQDTSDYYNLFKLSIKLEDILLFYKMLAVSGSEYMLEDFFLPLNETYKDKMRGICYIEFSTGILPDYKELTGISDEDLNYDDSDVLDYQDDEEADGDDVSSDDSLDLFNSMFSDDEDDVVIEDKVPDSIESKLDRVFDENRNTYDNFEYVSSGVDLDEVLGNTDDNLNETPYNSEDENDWEDDEDFEWEEEDSYSSEDDELDETPYADDDEESSYYDEDSYESPYNEDDEEDYVESEYGEEDSYESSYNEDDEEDYFESAYDEEDEYTESPYDEEEELDYEDESSYSEDESDYEDGYDESPYGEDEESDYDEDFEESPYDEEEESDYDESPYDEDEDIDESAYDDEDYGVDESSYGEDSDWDEPNTDELKENEKGTQTKDKREVDLGDELQDFTNSILTKLKRGAINFLNRRE